MSICTGSLQYLWIQTICWGLWYLTPTNTGAPLYQITIERGF